jgi:hypothetical protein
MNDNQDSAEQSQPTREMPRYKCHKEVWALRIAGIEQAPADQERQHADGDWYIKPADSGYSPVCVGHSFILKHKPEVGGYYVVYDDGYKSYSPAKAFENGYALMSANALQLGAAARAAGPEASYES